ncbi:MAG: putative membrane protein [Glaciecola sp.]
MVFLVVLKSTTGWIWGVLGLVGLFVGLMLAIKLYKSMRKV